MQNFPSYVLITSARNEARYIESTIKAVVAQSTRPLRWVIVSDGSTDGTDEIVKRYAREHDWIELMRMPERTERHFAGKAFAFRAGAARVADLPYDVIANLDADISFRSDYFAFLLSKIDLYPELGVAGTPYVSTSGETYDFRFTSIEHVSGACQVFRRECYEAIGGYAPVKVGAIDCIAVITARMKGWQTRTFPERVCIHHRDTGTAEQGLWRASVDTGAMDYAMGNHPLWQFLRVFYQMARQPYILRGIGVGWGFLAPALRFERRPVSREFLQFHRREQMGRLREKLGMERQEGGKRAKRIGSDFQTRLDLRKSE